MDDEELERNILNDKIDFIAMFGEEMSDYEEHFLRTTYHFFGGMKDKIKITQKKIEPE